ncbi:MAG: hypothetical protein LLF97_00910 [Planctomycetaceae bacterium]|nr:hypothetical protein [Planctomycetaceae bacterium]
MGERTQQPVHDTRGDIRVTTNNAKRQAVPTSLLGDFATVDSVPWAVQDNRVAPGNLEILQKTMREHPIDPNRVYLSGVSFGGSNCWTMAAGTASLCFGMLDASRCRPWQWWHLLVLPCAVLIFMRWTWHLEQRRCKTSADTPPPEHETAEMNFFVAPVPSECELPTEQ